MRTIRQLPIPQDGDNTKFPDGQIRNETTTETGTPVVREIYGDILTNIYKILRDAGITPNQQEDSETNGYQLLEALKVFANNTNDKRQLLNVSATNITAGFNFDNMPQNYVFIGIVSEALDVNESYDLLSGLGGSASYAVNLTTDIPASSTVLVIVNSTGSTILSIGAALTSQSTAILTTAFGTPLSFNDSSTLYYLSQGVIMTDYPRAYDVHSVIEGELGKPIAFIDAILFKKKLLCLCFDPDTLHYRIFAFNESNLNALDGEVNFDTDTGVDNQPYMYCDGKFLYFTNTKDPINGSINDFEVLQCNFDESALEITAVSPLTLDNRFEKTTNVFIDADGQKIYTFIAGTLYSYPFNGSNRTQVGFFPTIDGVVFEFNKNTYYSNGNVATQWAY